MPSFYHFTEILRVGDEMTKDNLYKCEIYKDFEDLLVNL